MPYHWAVIPSLYAVSGNSRTTSRYAGRESREFKAPSSQEVSDYASSL